VAAATNTTLVDYTFSAGTLTALHTVAIAHQVNSVRWMPGANYLVIACNGAAGFAGIRAYQETGAALTLLAGTITVAGNSNAEACAWYPAGTYVVVGTAAATAQVQSYPFTEAGGLAASVSSVTPGTVSRDAISFAPSGSYVAVGTATSPYLYLYPFSGAGAFGTAISPTGTSIPAGTVQCVDWSPNGNYLAVGLAAGTNRLAVYAYNATAGTVTLQSTTQVGEANTVYAVNWDKTGRYLLVGLATSTVSEFRVYYFNQTTQALICLYENATAIASNVQAARWSKDAKSIAQGTAAATLNVSAYSATQELYPLVLDNVDVTFNNDLTLSVSTQFNGACNLNGRGCRLDFQTGGELVARPGANVIVENIELTNLKSTLLRCMTNNASITLRNCILNLSGNYTFSQGALLFDNDVMVTGTCSFIYSSGLTSTISSQTRLFFDTGTTFSYVPSVARRNLLAMTDPSSILYFNGCTVFATRTGLQLSTGKLLLDGRVTMSSAARYATEGIGLSSNLDIHVLGGATLDVYGFVRSD
jgi:6-phosphogluconolactonase (cycloisomerase 2 family)